MLGILVGGAVLFLLVLAVLLGLGYALTLLLPLSLFEAALLLYLLGFGFLYVVRLLQEAAKDRVETPEAPEEWPKGITEITLPPDRISSRVEDVNLETLTHYLLAETLYREAVFVLYPEAVFDGGAFADSPKDLEALEGVGATIGQVLLTLVRTRPEFLQGKHVTNRDLRPLLMKVSPSKDLMANLSTVTEIVNVVLDRRRELLRLIAAHEGWMNQASD